MSGLDKNGQAYSIAVRYDAEGRPLTIATNTDAYELYWDDADRLIGVQINPGNPTTNIRWNYHYLGSQLVAATRVSYVDGTIKRFWAATDERGLVYRLLDEQGATYWQARWDASGWRQLAGVPQPDMWNPFALHGQVRLEGTDASASTNSRSAISLNRWRAYDPYVGGFLQSDPIDHSGRKAPEGYSFARSQTPMRADPDGLDPVFANCSEAQRFEIFLATTDAIRQIMSCAKGECQLGDKPPPWADSGRQNIVVARKWIYALYNMDGFTCLDMNHNAHSDDFNFNYSLAFRSHVNDDNSITTSMGSGGDAWAFSVTNPTQGRSERGWLVLGKFGIPDVPEAQCLSRIIAHEALHVANRNYIAAQDLFEESMIDEYGDLSVDGALTMPKGNDLEEYSVLRTSECVTCPK